MTRFLPQKNHLTNDLARRNKFPTDNLLIIHLHSVLLQQFVCTATIVSIFKCAEKTVLNMFVKYLNTVVHIVE